MDVGGRGAGWEEAQTTCEGRKGVEGWSLCNIHLTTPKPPRSRSALPQHPPYLSLRPCSRSPQTPL
jgi:hypothetical protein